MKLLDYVNWGEDIEREPTQRLGALPAKTSHLPMRALMGLIYCLSLIQILPVVLIAIAMVGIVLYLPAMSALTLIHSLFHVQYLPCGDYCTR